MPYRYLNFLENSLIHVFNRGNNHNLLFKNLSDYKWFINKSQKLEVEKKFWSQTDFQASLYGTYFRRPNEYADFVNDGMDEYKKVKKWLFD